ncbi:hypothetical protein [Pedobacter alluvionis]|nr:hypothetical protein [Pedobacter alluvionis]TFB33220.1 hypothetical protein E3V97_04015 [Pedobacter alluvionis]
MTADELLNFFKLKAPQTVDAISTGAGWEIWLQTELILALRGANQGYSGARELPYPSPLSRSRLDIGIGHNQEYYAIEMKVESPTRAKPFLSRILKDVTKIGYYAVQGSQVKLSKYVVGIGYGVAAKAQMKQYSIDNAGKAGYSEQSGLGILLIVVS